MNLQVLGAALVGVVMIVDVLFADADKGFMFEPSWRRWERYNIND